MVCDAYSHVSICRYVWYVMLTALLVYVGLYGM